MSDEKRRPSDIVAQKKNLNHIKRHIFLCIGEKCCSQNDKSEVWDYLKQQMLAKELVGSANDEEVFRTKVACLRVCVDGPVAVVYPEGTWYRLIDKEAIDRIIQEHLIEGRPVAEFKFCESRLNSVNEPLNRT